MQALDRTAPILPMMPAVPGRVTHDYVRHASTRQPHRTWTCTSCWTTTPATRPPPSSSGCWPHPRFHLHFTPTYSSWLNLVERWFAELTNRKLRRSGHRSVAALEADVATWIEACNADPKPFVWTKSADQILETIAAYCQRINDSAH
jgi:transposase